MTARAALLLFLFGLLTGLLLASLGGGALPWTRDAQLEHYREVRDFAREAFVREVSDEELLDAALHGMLDGLDRYSRYYDPAERAALERETSGRYEGIGVVFRPPFENGQVLFCLEDSPASDAGVRVGDTFVRVGGRAARGMSAEELRTAIAQPEAGVLAIELVRLDGSEQQIELRPRELVDPTVRHMRLVDAAHGIGYISLLSFSNETPREFDEAFRFLRERGMRALILDLRRNYGGALLSAEAIAGRFIDEGVIVRTEGRGEPKLSHARPEQALWVGFPLALLTDGDSASASEVLAGALQDHRRAVLVGSPTYGKGLVQTIRRFDERGAVAKVTSAYYYSPSGRNFDKSVDESRQWGILPDVSLELERSEQDAIHAFLGRYGPPPSALRQIEAWQEHEEQALIGEHPPDPQLAAAVALLLGQQPGPRQLALDD